MRRQEGVNETETMLRGDVAVRCSWIVRCIVLLALPLLVEPAGTQVIKIKDKSAARTAESINMFVTPAIINFTLATGRSVVASSPVKIYIVWKGLSTSTNLTLYAYFDSAALTGTHESRTIPASAIYGQLLGSSVGGGYVPFMRFDSVENGGAGFKIFSVPLGAKGASNSLSEALLMKIDLVSLPQLPPDTYTGTLTFQVQDL
jgi:hypothetical protein